MGRVEKTVFVSYRRQSVAWALAIYQSLRHNGFDVFFDYEGVASGDFANVILENIRARAHFLILLTPSALERCDEPGDLLRLEIETALESRRNIVPLLLENFEFDSPVVAGRFNGSIEPLRRYNGLRVHADYFDEAMLRLQSRHLNVALDTVSHPVSLIAQRAAAAQQAAASNAPAVQPDDLTAEKWIERAYESKDYETQIYCLEKAAALRPLDSRSSWQLARAYIRNHRPQAALEYYSDAIRLDPAEADLYSERADVLREMGDIPGAVRDMDAAVRVAPSDARAYWRRAFIRRDAGDIDGAIDDLTVVLNLERNPKDLQWRAELRANKGDAAGALADYSEAIACAPRDPEGYLKRAEFKQTGGDVAGACEDLATAAALAPNDSRPLMSLASLSHAKGDLDDAIRWYTEASALVPHDDSPLRQLAEIQQAKGNLAEAERIYDDIVRLRPDKHNLYWRALLRRDRANYTGAIEDYTAALKVSPRDGGLYFGRAECRGNLGDDEGAVADYTEAIRLRPDEGHYYRWRGRAMARLGRLREALEDLDEAVRLDPDSSIMFSDRAFVRRESGDLDGSLSDCEQAMRLDPEFQRPYLHRARAHEARGNVAAAIADYDEYLKRGGGRLFEDQSEIEGRLQDLRESQK